MNEGFSPTLSFLKYSTSDKSLSAEEVNKWQDVHDHRRGEILAKMSISEIEKEFTLFFIVYSFPSNQHKQNVKRSLQRIVPKVFPGFGCEIKINEVKIRRLRIDEVINDRGKIIQVSYSERNSSIFGTNPNSTPANTCKNCAKLEEKIIFLEQLIKAISSNK